MYILLFLFWLLLCGRLTAETVLLGLAIVAALSIPLRLLFGYRPKLSGKLLRRGLLFIAYLPVLVAEIFKAGFAVSRCILFPRRKLTPTLITFRPNLKTELGRFLLANSITLTPGTITVRVEDDRLTVHCLDSSMLDCSENSVFQRWIRAMEA